MQLSNVLITHLVKNRNFSYAIKFAVNAFLRGKFTDLLRGGGGLITTENISFLENVYMCMIPTVPPSHAYIKYRVVRLRIC